MFHLVGFSESQDEGGVMTRMTAIPDQSIRAIGDTITIGELNQLIGEFACLGSTGDEARLISPSLRRVNPLSITPVEQALNPQPDPASMFHPDSPIPLMTNEALEAENNADPAAAEQHTILAWLADGVQAAVSGHIYTVNCTCTLAKVAGLWVFSELTFPDSLPVGRYSVVGARAEVSNGIAFRFVPVGAAHRPGSICVGLPNGRDLHSARYGRLGRWFDFDVVQPPGIEILSSAAGASATYDIFIDLLEA